MSSSSHVTVATYADPIQASLARNYLEENDIPVVMTDEETVSVDWSLGFALGGIKLQVAPWHLERAEFLLAQHQRVTKEREEAEAVEQTAFTTPDAVEDLRAEQEDRLPINQNVDRLLRTTIIGLLLWPLQLLALWWLIEYLVGKGVPSADRRWKVKAAALLNVPLLAIVLVPTVLLFSAVFNKPHDPNKPDWQTEWFKSQNFRVKFPAAAALQNLKAWTPLGEVNRRAYWSLYKSAWYGVSCDDLFPPGKAEGFDEGEFLEASVLGWDPSPNAKVVRKERIVADSVPGIEADIESPTLGFIRLRLFVWARRAYVVQVIAANEAALPQENQRVFFNSLRLFGR